MQLGSSWRPTGFRPYKRGILAHIVLNSFKRSVTNWRTDQMKMFVVGSSITSCYWNGAATYYRGIYKHLHELGHEIVFAEPDIYGRQQRRDAESCDYVQVRVYASPRETDSMLAEAATADLVIKHSG